MDFCSTQGIKRQLSTSYTPQQNGVAERKNRTLMNMVRCLLVEGRMPRSFWTEAATWSVHIINRSPTAAVTNKTPEECWTGHKPNVAHFRIFGCVTYVHVPNEKRIKLEDKSYKCVFLGVSEESKAYRLYDPESKKIVTSRDVIFAEEETWNWGRTNDEELTWDDTDSFNGTDKEEGDGITIDRDEVEIPGEQTAEQTAAQIEETRRPTFIPSSQENRREQTRRISIPPRHLQDYVTGEDLAEQEEEEQYLVLYAAEEDPVKYDEAVKDIKWRKAMDAEIQAIEKNNAWELVALPKGMKKIRVKWVFKTKLNEKGEVDKHKARLVVKGYAQRQGIDYSEVFSPVARWDTIRMLLSLAALRGWEVFQLDVKSAFLHGELKEVVYIEQPEGYIRKGEEQKVYQLKNALYGLKQAPRAWYSRLEDYFAGEGFEKCSYELTLFMKKKGGRFFVVSLYVDDLIFTGNDLKLCAEFKASMQSEFDMTDLGRMKYFLGVEIHQTEAGIFLCQGKYASEILARFGMGSCNAVNNPMVPGTKLSSQEKGEEIDSTEYKQLIGSLIYITTTRPDIMYAVSFLSRFMAAPKEGHLLAAKRILRYLKGTMNFGIFYKRSSDNTLKGYTDSDFAGDLDGGKSTSGYVFMMGDGAVAWSSKKQPIVTLSTTEAEYVAATACACQSIWMREVLNSIEEDLCKCVTVFCDNSSSIKLSKNPVFHGRTKHINVKFHFIRDLIKKGDVELMYCRTKEQLADIMTKPLKLEDFVKLRMLLGVQEKKNLN